MKSQRQLQIGETIKRIISEIFLRDDILTVPGSYITILEADVSPDAKNARIYIDIFGNEPMHEKIVEKLKTKKNCCQRAGETGNRCGVRSRVWRFLCPSLLAMWAPDRNTLRTR